jgi:exonuclease SbcC
VEKDLAIQQTALSQADQDVEQIERALKPFGKLDADLEKTRQLAERTQPAHDQYLQHSKRAAEVAGLDQQVKELSVKHDKACAEIKELRLQLGQASGSYDGKKHKALDKQYQDLKEEASECKADLRNFNSQLKDEQNEIRRLKGLIRDLDARNAELTELNTVLDTLDCLRHTIRDAGPEVTRMLVGRVSYRAAKLYSEIMSDHSSRLAWHTDGYGITTSDGSQEREFGQMSGGEKMAAALAVRLALIHEISSVDIAFFDEPTSNLDPERRESLADQISQLGGFSQLFVISHDDTFERITQNVLRVQRGNGVSNIRPA